MGDGFLGHAMDAIMECAWGVRLGVRGEEVGDEGGWGHEWWHEWWAADVWLSSTVTYPLG
jgi:hypothetical protein